MGKFILIRSRSSHILYVMFVKLFTIIKKEGTKQIETGAHKRTVCLVCHSLYKGTSPNQRIHRKKLSFARYTYIHVLCVCIFDLFLCPLFEGLRDTIEIK